jgi:Muramidase (flagellum-specific)
MRIDKATATANPVDWLQAVYHESFPKTLKTSPRLAELEIKQLTPQQIFFRKYASYAIHTQRLTGIPASVTLAQAAIESGWGRHAPSNNFFGIKGKGPAGSQWLWTREFRQGRMHRVRARFRRYETPLQSFVDHAQIIAKGSNLRHAMQHTDSARAFVTALQSGRRKYATDPNYSDKILDLIQLHHLDRLDLGEGS